MRIVTLAAAVLVAAGWALPQDLPVHLREGTIEIESPALEFSKFNFFFGAGQTQDDARIWEHPTSKTMRRIDVDGNNRADCRGSASCAVYAIFDDGTLIIVSSTQNNGRGLRIVSTRRWGEYEKANDSRLLIFRGPSGGPKITSAWLLVTRGNTTTRTELCTARCAVRIGYE
jgi:hypothetical protein